MRMSNQSIPMSTTPSAVSRKRTFPGASSSSHGRKEKERLEVSPPVSHVNPFSSDEKEVISHKTIIDLEDDNEVMILDENAGKGAKGKETFAVGNTSTTNGAYGINVLKNVHDFGSNSDFVWSIYMKRKKSAADELNTFKPSHCSSGFKISENQSTASPVTSACKVDPEIKYKSLEKYVAFKKFDTVKVVLDHKFSRKRFKIQPRMDWCKRIQEEWEMLMTGLPDQIFVRAYESRMELMRAVIVGAEGTPYHDGLYFFDIYFPPEYPKEPPKVHYCSGGHKINPNLYKCGKVCLSLLGTWMGKESNEMWVPEKSTMLQVLVSIQGLILNAKPFLNEPGLSYIRPDHENVFEYNEQVFTLSLKTMLFNIRRPPKHFEDFVAGHFSKHGRDILVYCKAYMDGAQVGCLVKGGIQDVDEGDRSCSQKFKNNLAALITSIIDAFSQIGARDCEEFRSLAQKATGEPEPYFD